MQRYSLAVAIGLAAILARLALNPVWELQHPFILFFPAVAASAWIGGWGAGLITTVLCAVAADFFWLPPVSSLGIGNPADVGGLVVFAAVGAFMSALNEGWQRAERERAALLGQEQTAGEQASAAERQLQFALEAGRLGTWEWQIGSGTVAWSTGLEAIHGLPPGSFAGTFAAVQAEIHAADRQRVQESIQASVEQGKDYHEEYRIVRTDGVVRWVEGRGRVYRSATGQPERMVGICSDVTDRKQAEERFRLAVEAAPTAMVVVDGSGTITLVNALLEQLTGYARSELVGESIELLVPRDRRSGHTAFRTSFVAAPRQRPMGAGRELHILHKNGTAIPVEIGLNPIDTGDGTFVIAGVTDITERQRAELAVREAKEEAEGANRAKDEFLAVVSHELRNPVNAILGWAQMLKAGVAPHQVAQGLEVIERSARIEAQLVESLLDLSRIVSGKLKLEIGTVDLVSIVETALDVVRPTADIRGVQLAADLPRDPVPIAGDGARLQQVLWNLLSNGIKFTPRGGRVQVSLTTGPDYALVVVSDTGEGISQEFLPQVFGRFTQAEDEDGRSRGGLGLGLAIVQELVHAHGGSIEAASPGLGLGSTFTVSLPLAPPDPPRSGADWHRRGGSPR